MNPLEPLRRIAEVEFAAIVAQTDVVGSKLRVLLTDSSYVDVWASRKLNGRFGFHWERRHLDGRIFRYDNFPDTNWAGVETFPFHFHNGDQLAAQGGRVVVRHVLHPTLRDGRHSLPGLPESSPLSGRSSR